MKKKEAIRIVGAILFIAIGSTTANAQLFRGRFFRPFRRPAPIRVERFETTLTPKEAALIEAKLIAAANDARRRARLNPLTPRTITGEIRKHSERMAANRDCFHMPGATQEICAAWQRTPQEAINSWLTSTVGHQEELLNPSYRYVEAGVARDGNGYFYWTLKFL